VPPPRPLSAAPGRRRSAGCLPARRRSGWLCRRTSSAGDGTRPTSAYLPVGGLPGRPQRPFDAPPRPRAPRSPRQLRWKASTEPFPEPPPTGRSEKRRKNSWSVASGEYRRGWRARYLPAVDDRVACCGSRSRRRAPSSESPRRSPTGRSSSATSSSARQATRPDLTGVVPSPQRRRLRTGRQERDSEAELPIRGLPVGHGQPKNG